MPTDFLTLQDAISWCSEHNVKITFLPGACQRSKNRVVIQVENFAAGGTCLQHAVERAKILIRDLRSKKEKENVS